MTLPSGQDPLLAGPPAMILSTTHVLQTNKTHSQMRLTVAYGKDTHTCSGGATDSIYHMISLSGTDYQHAPQNLHDTGTTQDLLSIDRNLPI
jgi:hypothetical protein